MDTRDRQLLQDFIDLQEINCMLDDEIYTTEDLHDREYTRREGYMVEALLIARRNNFLENMRLKYLHEINREKDDIRKVGLIKRYGSKLLLFSWSEIIIVTFNQFWYNNGK